jgi:hypothetical protein
MNDLGELHYCLLVEVKRAYKNSELYIIQRKYMENILELFRMDECKSTFPPSQVRVCLLTNTSLKKNMRKRRWKKCHVIVWLVTLFM